MKPTVWKRRAGVVAVVASVAVAAVLLLRPAPLPIEVDRATRGRLQVTVDEDGQTRVRHRYLVVAPVTGRVAHIVLDAGDAVEEGAVVARVRPLALDPRSQAEAEARLAGTLAAEREAGARVARAEAAADQARRSATRARILGGQGIVAREERERAELEEATHARELDAAIANARTATANVAAARAALVAAAHDGGGGSAAACEEGPESCIALRSPVRGTVLRVPEESERVVLAGTLLLEIADPNALEVVIDVLSADAVTIRPGAPVSLEQWGGGTALRARVRVVEPSAFTKVSALGVEEQRVNVVADFIDSPTALGDGYRIEARIVVWEADDVLKVPIGALFRQRGQWQVFTVERGRAHRRNVELGHMGTEQAEVIEGLAEGETVIMHPSDEVQEGLRVETS